MVDLMNIIDTSGINVDDPVIRACLVRDLREAFKDVDPKKAPEGCNACYIKLTPTKISRPGVSPFDISMQYGLAEGDKFYPLDNR